MKIIYDKVFDKMYSGNVTRIYNMNRDLYKTRRSTLIFNIIFVFIFLKVSKFNTINSTKTIRKQVPKQPKGPINTSTDYKISLIGLLNVFSVFKCHYSLHWGTHFTHLPSKFFHGETHLQKCIRSIMPTKKACILQFLGCEL